MKNTRKGFTITELVIVIAVIAILAAVLIPTFSSIIKKANHSAVLQEAKNLHTTYISAVNFAAGETAQSTACIKVVKGDDTYYVKVSNNSVVDEISDRAPTTPGTLVIEADSFATDGVKWTFIECEDGDHEFDLTECTICHKPK